MGFAGVALAVIVVLVGGFVAPRRIDHRQAVLQSREGDRFSEGLRMVKASAPLESVATSARKEASKSSVPLLTSPRQIESSEGAVMSQAKAPRRTPRIPTGRTLHMNPEQARRLTALKSRRAARVSREAAAAQRRLITTGISLALVLLFVGLATFTAMGWAWTAVPGAFLIGTLVASRQAGIRNEREQAEETRKIRELEEEIYVGRRPKAAAPAEVPAKATVETVEVAPEFVAPESAPDSAVDSAAAEVSEPAPVAEEAAEATEEADRSWSVASFPAPSYARKEKVTGRQVHPDTDIVAVAQVSKVPGRPVAATRVDEPAVVEETPMTGGFDLESVLEARLAAR